VMMATNGNAAVMRVFLDRLMPKKRGTAVRFRLPKIASQADVALACEQIAEAIATGDVTPTEAADLMRVVESMARALRLAENKANAAEMAQLLALLMGERGLRRAEPAPEIASEMEMTCMPAPESVAEADGSLASPQIADDGPVAESPSDIAPEMTMQREPASRVVPDVASEPSADAVGDCKFIAEAMPPPRPHGDRPAVPPDRSG
jgi:hypothetical protein